MSLLCTHLFSQTTHGVEAAALTNQTNKHAFLHELQMSEKSEHQRPSFRRDAVAVTLVIVDWLQVRALVESDIETCISLHTLAIERLSVYV